MNSQNDCPGCLQVQGLRSDKTIRDVFHITINATPNNPIGAGLRVNVCRPDSEVHRPCPVPGQIDGNVGEPRILYNFIHLFAQCPGCQGKLVRPQFQAGNLVMIANPQDAESDLPERFFSLPYPPDTLRRD